MTEALSPAFKRNPRSGTLLSDSAAALLSSSVFATAFYPLHRIKILLQTQDSNLLVLNGKVRRYTVLDAAPRLLREGGLRELWRGNAAYMLRHVPSTTLSFAFKDALLRHLPHYSGPDQLGRAAVMNLAAGFVGGAAALLLVYPLDFATIRMAAELRQHKKAQGVLDTLNSTQRSGGIAALYRGYGVSAAAIGAYKALYFGLYDTACTAMEQRYARLDAAAAAAAASAVAAPAAAQSSPDAVPDPSPADKAPLPQPLLQAQPLPVPGPQHHHLGVLERWAAANLVVVTASSVTYPLDVVRKRLVADTALGPQRQQYRGLMDCVAKIAAREGFRGFYRFYPYDMILRMGGGVLLVMYDEIKAHGPGAAARHLLALLPSAPAAAVAGKQPQPQPLPQPQP